MKALPQFRMIDGVVVAAVALLALKVLGLLAPAPADRVEDGFGRVFAHARTNYVPGDPMTTGSVPDKKPEPAPEPPASAAPAAPAPPLTAPSSTEKVLFDRLGARREELQQRQREMEAREKLLEEQERKLDDRVGQGRAAEEAARREAAAAKAAAEAAALKSLVIMYEGMKPKEAARVFDRLPMDVLLPIVTAMNARKMPEVLAAMGPDAAEKLTVALAKRARGSVDARPAAASALPPGELSAIEPVRR